MHYDARHFTIEHGHTSIGYYASLVRLQTSGLVLPAAA